MARVFFVFWFFALGKLEFSEIEIGHLLQSKVSDNKFSYRADKERMFTLVHMSGRDWMHFAAGCLGSHFVMMQIL